MKKTSDEAFDESLRISFRENLEQAKLKLALLKENFEYRDWFDRFLDWHTHTPASEKVWPGGEFARFGLVQLRFFIGGPNWRHVLDLINPHKDINAAPSSVVTGILPRLFYDYAVESIEVGKDSHFEGGRSRPIRNVNDRGLKPWERLYKVDLSKKKAQIMREFEGYLDRAYLGNVTPDTTRDRAEAWDYLKIWGLWKEGKTYPEIARALHITADAVKKGFARACELTQGRKYDRATLKKLQQTVRKTGIKQTCETCPKREHCKEPCDDMQLLADQDYVSLREILS